MSQVVAWVWIMEIGGFLGGWHGGYFFIFLLWLVLGAEGFQECCKMEFWFRWDFGGPWAMVAWWAWWCYGADWVVWLLREG